MFDSKFEISEILSRIINLLESTFWTHFGDAYGMLGSFSSLDSPL